MGTAASGSTKTVGSTSNEIFVRNRAATLSEAIETRDRQIYLTGDLKQNVFIIDTGEEASGAPLLTEREFSVIELFHLIEQKVRQQRGHNYHDFVEYKDLHILNVRNLMLKSISSKANVDKDVMTDFFGTVIYHTYDLSVTFQRYVVMVSIEDVNCILTPKTMFLLVPASFDRRKFDAIADAFDSNKRVVLPAPGNVVEFEFLVYDRIMLIFKTQFDNDVISARESFQHIRMSLILLEGKSCILSSDFEIDLRRLLKKLTKLESNLNKYISFFSGLINSDNKETMKFMSLHQFCLSGNTTRADIDCQLVTILFEEYLVYYTADLNNVTDMRSSLDARLEVLKLRLDSSRNELFLLNSYFTLLFVFLSFASFVANVIVGSIFDEVWRVATTYFIIAIFGSMSVYCALLRFKVIPTYIDYKKLEPLQRLSAALAPNDFTTLKNS